MDEQYFDVFKTWFIGSHNTNLPGARFDIGQVVLYRGVEQVVLAVNHVEEGTYEYALDIDWPLAVWEDELTKVERYLKIYLPATNAYHVCKATFRGEAVMGDWYATSYPNCIADGIFATSRTEPATETEYLAAKRLLDALYELIAKAEVEDGEL